MTIALMMINAYLGWMIVRCIFKERIILESIQKVIAEEHR